MRSLGNLLKKKRTKDSRNSRDLDLPASPVAESPSSRKSTSISTNNPGSPTAITTSPHPPPLNPLVQHPAASSLDSSRPYPASSTRTDSLSAQPATTTTAPTATTTTTAPRDAAAEVTAAAAAASSLAPAVSSSPVNTCATSTTSNSQPSLPMNPIPSSTPFYSNIASDPSQFKQQQQQQPHHYQNVASIKNIINPPNQDEVESSQQRVGDGQHVPSQQQPQQPQQPQQHEQQQQYEHQQQQNEQQRSVQSTRQTKGKYSLDDFTLQRTLGTGSFGRVHLVQSRHNQRFYAIKVLKKAQVVKMKQVEHTNDERKMLQRVKHPFLITLWGTFQDAKNLYMVMDFVEGGELFSLLRKSQRFPNPVAKFYAAEVTLALEYLHDHHIVYRDLKPENLLLDRHGHLKITDFGFAKEVRDITWTLCGTPDYLAPEVVSSKGYNMSVDWWSLGILIFEMLCGFTPFWDGGSPMRIYENILKCRVKYPPYMHPDAQDLLSQLITPDLTVRLGNLHGGSQDVKNHPWFAEVTWDRLARKDIDAPYIPPVKGGQGDASQFDRYPEETEAYGGGGDDPYGHYFVDF
ncbi:AGC/PKA protein kinase [Blastomyces gilchristii SLH14081]|uniref:cAMP-dependent protein kinase n=1 Tax=Blastomyces gilchristii (strain SLH14081) TaxID=559298 RepID=A0A179UPG1_BLAGS|nr:AGC/PKA protein kinase [Blastomyces gilchristii SLH14081]OAT09976.1 AGC/PKA protein kinase [Blastomyces gilchristii SLH14081]